jgi:hypothetical protein
VNERELMGLSAGGVRKFVALLILSREFEGNVASTQPPREISLRERRKYANLYIAKMRQLTL